MKTKIFILSILFINLNSFESLNQYELFYKDTKKYTCIEIEADPEVFYALKDLSKKYNYEVISQFNYLKEQNRIIISFCKSLTNTEITNLMDSLAIQISNTYKLPIRPKFPVLVFYQFYFLFVMLNTISC